MKRKKEKEVGSAKTLHTLCNEGKDAYFNLLLNQKWLLQSSLIVATLFNLSLKDDRASQLLNIEK